jgi:hypothetical protein
MAGMSPGLRLDGQDFDFAVGAIGQLRMKRQGRAATAEYPFVINHRALPWSGTLTGLRNTHPISRRLDTTGQARYGTATVVI